MTSAPIKMPVRGQPDSSDGEAAPGQEPKFRFVDLFAGIGGIRGGLQRAGGECVFSVEIDRFARRTYSENWGELDWDDVTTLTRGQLKAKPYEILAAGFPCQPFSIAGVSKRQSLGRAHGFDDLTSGNLFFEIVKLVGGPADVGTEELRYEAEAPFVDEDSEEQEFLARTPGPSDAPPVLLLENVRHLVSHDQGRTYRVIRRRLLKSGYRVSQRVINGAAWVPQNRRRTIIVGLNQRDFARRFEFPDPPSPANGPRLNAALLEQDLGALEAYRLTDGVWRALKAHRTRHLRKGNGFGYGIADIDGVTRTLSARYYKDGAEILLRMGESERPRRLTPAECAMLMGFTPEHLGKPFVIPADISDARAYRQFGNSVVVPQFTWLGDRICDYAAPLFRKRLAGRRRV
jgi:DNA (cytosine-5)-methyltransferase 1